MSMIHDHHRSAQEEDYSVCTMGEVAGSGIFSVIYISLNLIHTVREVESMYSTTTRVPPGSSVLLLLVVESTSSSGR